MKVLEKDETSSITRYDVSGELENGDRIAGTLSVMWDNDVVIPEYSFKFIKQESDVELTNEQIEAFKDLAISFTG